MPQTFPMGLTTNDLLEQYQKSPAATRRFKRMDLSGPSPIKSNLSVSTQAGGAGNFNFMDPLPLSDPPTFLMSTTIVAQTLLTSSLPRNLMSKLTRTSQLATRHLTSAQSHTQFLSEDNNGSTSGIDLKVPLDTMAVQLEYQLDLPNGSDSDDESHLLRDNESKFEDESLDSAPLSSLRGLPDRGPSRSSFLQMCLLSSLHVSLFWSFFIALQTTFPSSKARVNHVHHGVGFSKHPPPSGRI
jgi:hypothetical protein